MERFRKLIGIKLPAAEVIGLRLVCHGLFRQALLWEAGCEGVIKLDQHDEGDAPARVDDTEERPQGVERLRDFDAAADGCGNVEADIIFDQS